MSTVDHLTYQREAAAIRRAARALRVAAREPGRPPAEPALVAGARAVALAQLRRAVR